MLRPSLRMHAKIEAFLSAQPLSTSVGSISRLAREQSPQLHRLPRANTATSLLDARRGEADRLGKYLWGRETARHIGTLDLREKQSSFVRRTSYRRACLALGATGHPIEPPVAEVALYGFTNMSRGEAELVLNREDFTREFRVVAVKVPAKRTSELQGRLKKELLNMPHRKNVERCPGDDSARLLLLSTAVKNHETLLGLSSEAAAFLKGDEAISTTMFEVRVGYSNLGVEEVLKRLLSPLLPGREIPTSFETAGHLAHLNLKDYLLPYKEVIGQVIIDKNPRITTVVNKVDTISTRFRTFPMEVIAGEPNTQVEMKESGCTFRFDFSKVYWNSRLQGEHARLIRIIRDSGREKVVCDMMAGVGPFAVPLAKGGHRVYANDLNPESFVALRQNALKNKVAGRMTSSNECGRLFARGLVREGKVFHHAILNLPDSAISFLDVFRDVDWRARGFETPPLVHVYCFSKAADPKQDALDRANDVMGSALTARDVKIHVVRDVAPNKPMLCLSFAAPDAAASSPCSSLSPSSSSLLPSSLSSLPCDPAAGAGAGAGAREPSSSGALASVSSAAAASPVGADSAVCQTPADAPEKGEEAAAVPGGVREGGAMLGIDGSEGRLSQQDGVSEVGCGGNRGERLGGEVASEVDCKRRRTDTDGAA